MQKEDFSKLPELVSEVLKEEEASQGTKGTTARLMRDHIATTKCSCGVRDFLKQLVRRLRGFDDKLPHYRDELKKRLRQGVKELT